MPASRSKLDRNKGRVLPALMAGTFLLVLTTTASSEQRPSFDLPVNCKTKDHCLVQNLVDMDPSDTRADALCGRSTYNGHKGTDFRTRNIKEMNKGVAVFAMADGFVGGMRNTAPDVLVITNQHKKAVKGVECGNGLIIDHGRFDGNQWTTQYCHLKQGSVTLKKGETIKRGQKIGEIGLSGMTVFPHVHVTIRRGTKPLDPFTGKTMGDTSTCGMADSEPLFTAKALELLLQKDSPLIDAGFAGDKVSKIMVLRGEIPKPAVNKPLVFYASFKNLLRGDRIRITIKNGAAVTTSSTTEPLPVDKASYSVYAGKRRGIKRNVEYQGIAEILRSDKAIFSSPPKTIKF